MIEKLRIAHRLRTTHKQPSSHFYYNERVKEICYKCYISYVRDCIFKGEDTFKLVFKEKNIEGFFTRIKRLKGFTFSCGLSYLFNPIKVTNSPSEYVLELILGENGFRIVDEYLGVIDTKYVVKRINC